MLAVVLLVFSVLLFAWGWTHRTKSQFTAARAYSQAELDHAWRVYEARNQALMRSLMTFEEWLMCEAEKADWDIWEAEARVSADEEK